MGYGQLNTRQTMLCSKGTLAQCSEQWERRVQGAGCVSSDRGGLAGRPAVAGGQDQEERPRCAPAPAALTSGQACGAPIEKCSGKHAVLCIATLPA
jgi:hypothetical protein